MDLALHGRRIPGGPVTVHEVEVLRRTIRGRKRISTDQNGSYDETGKPHSHEGLLKAREERHSEFAMP
jgi:hypothetical protein